MATDVRHNYSHIARPYALAAFEYARDHQALAEWRAFLITATTIAEDKRIIQLLGNPILSADRVGGIFNDILKPLLDAPRRHFLALLIEHNRLIALPSILNLFNTYQAALDKISQVRVITAIEAQEEFRQKLTQALKKRTARDVTLKYEVDPAILGGAIIHMGDRVIDGSVRGKLSRLLKALTG